MTARTDSADQVTPSAVAAPAEPVAANPPQGSSADEREAFEKWWQSLTEISPMPVKERCWTGWQARAALAPVVQDGALSDERAPKSRAWLESENQSLYEQTVFLSNQIADLRSKLEARAAPPSDGAKPVAEVGIGKTGRPDRAAFFRLTDAGRNLPAGTHRLYAAPDAARDAPAAEDVRDCLLNRIAHAENVCKRFDAVPAVDAKRVIGNVFAELREAFAAALKQRAVDGRVSSMDHGGVGQVGCERPDGTLNIHGAAETCEVCAAEDARAMQPATKGEGE